MNGSRPGIMILKIECIYKFKMVNILDDQEYDDAPVDYTICMQNDNR